VKQGFLELPNINVVKDMVDLVQVTRIYESFQKAILSVNEATQKSINEVGRLG
jgi:flagellar basal-body rod protein FlgG